LVAFDSRISQQKSGLESLASVVRKIEGDIARGERISAGRERDRDALLGIEQSLQDEGDVARESRVRLEEFEFEIKEAQKKLDAIAVKLAEKRAEEEDLRLSKVLFILANLLLRFCLCLHVARWCGPSRTRSRRRRTATTRRRSDCATRWRA
jgi:hypothetical protein